MWWTISNNKNKYDANLLGNVVSANDDKFAFFLKFADWLEEWANVLISALASIRQMLLSWP